MFHQGASWGQNSETKFGKLKIDKDVLRTTGADGNSQYWFDIPQSVRKVGHLERHIMARFQIISTIKLKLDGYDVDPKLPVSIMEGKSILVVLANQGGFGAADDPLIEIVKRVQAMEVDGEMPETKDKKSKRKKKIKAQPHTSTPLKHSDGRHKSIEDHEHTEDLGSTFEDSQTLNLKNTTESNKSYQVPPIAQLDSGSPERHAETPDPDNEVVVHTSEVTTISEAETEVSSPEMTFGDQEYDQVKIKTKSLSEWSTVETSQCESIVSTSSISRISETTEPNTPVVSPRSQEQSDSRFGTTSLSGCAPFGTSPGDQENQAKNETYKENEKQVPPATTVDGAPKIFSINFNQSHKNLSDGHDLVVKPQNDGSHGPDESSAKSQTVSSAGSETSVESEGSDNISSLMNKPETPRSARALQRMLKPNIVRSAPPSTPKKHGYYFESCYSEPRNPRSVQDSQFFPSLALFGDLHKFAVLSGEKNFHPIRSINEIQNGSWIQFSQPGGTLPSPKNYKVLRVNYETGSFSATPFQMDDTISAPFSADLVQFNFNEILDSDPRVYVPENFP